MARKNPVNQESVVEERERFVLLLRHGIAQDKGTKPDAERSLTATGHQRMKKIGKAIAEIFPKAEVILSSPLLRATQTAAWVSKGYDRSITVTETAALAPGGTAAALRAAIHGAGASDVICVGHEPGLSEAMLALTGMRSSDPMELKKGGCYGIRLRDKGHATLEWILPPRVLRRE